MAIPLITITAKRVQNFYDCIDSAYDQPEIADYSLKGTASLSPFFFFLLIAKHACSNEEEEGYARLLETVDEEREPRLIKKP